MKRSFPLPLAFLLAASLLLNACSSQVDLGKQVSNEGLIPEAFIPADTGLFFSYSLRDDNQYEAVQVLEEKLGEDIEISDLFTQQLDARYEMDGVSYIEDILPALGERFRAFSASREGRENADVFTVLTLENPDKMRDVFDALIEQSFIEEKKLSNNDAYVNEENDFYASIYKDLLFIANKPEALVEMIGIKEKDSLWENETFKSLMEDVGSDYLFFGGIFPSMIQEDIDLPAGLGLGSISELIDRQFLVLRAEEEGLRFDAYVIADEDAAREADVSFDVIPREDAYLMRNVPAGGLMAYFESYGLQQSFAEANAVGGNAANMEQFTSFIQNYFGMDFQDEILSFMDKGFLFAIHKNAKGVAPGFSIMFDASSNTDLADEFLNKLDGQLASLQLLFEQSLPGAIVKSDVEIMGSTLAKIKVDMNAISENENYDSLPQMLKDSEIQLIYGMVDDMMLISTASIWEEESDLSVYDSELYQMLNGKLEDVDQGLFLVDTQSISDFFASLRALRDQLGLDNSEIILTAEDILQGFKGFIASGKTETYESHIAGYLMID